eukprot:14320418-Alexandrium_andersonii.AAC.1
MQNTEWRSHEFLIWFGRFNAKLLPSAVRPEKHAHMLMFCFSAEANRRNDEATNFVEDVG